MAETAGKPELTGEHLSPSSSTGLVVQLVLQVAPISESSSIYIYFPGNTTIKDLHIF